MNTNVKRLTAGAMFVALSVILSMLKIVQMPFGGSITALSMLPVCIYAYKYGIKWGLLGGFTYGVIQMLIGSAGGPAAAGMSAGDFMLMMFLDYLLAYTCLGLASMGKKLCKGTRAGLTAGILIAACVRLLCHSLSGYILFRSYAEWYFSQEGFTFGAYVLEHMNMKVLPFFYAFFYNASYLVPETVLTVIAALIVASMLKKQLAD